VEEQSNGQLGRRDSGSGRIKKVVGVNIYGIEVCQCVDSGNEQKHSSEVAVPLSAWVWSGRPPCPWGPERSPSSPPLVSAGLQPQFGWL